MKNGMKTMTKLKEKAIPNWESEMKKTFRKFLLEGPEIIVIPDLFGQFLINF